jgi:mannose-1-phosphate guanylyltransferase
MTVERPHPAARSSGPPAPPSDPHLHIVILAGGIGARFWPASTPSRPKQLLPLASHRPLIVDTVERARRLVSRDRLHILAGRHLVDPLRAALGEEDETLFWVEPRARGTGPVLAWAARRIRAHDPDGVMVSLHADHAIAPGEAFVEVVREAARLARQTDLLYTVAVPPDRPETGYGYLRPGEAVDGEGSVRAWRVGAFVEKPDEATALRYLSEGYLWNSGIFVWTASRFLEEVIHHAPEISDHLPLLDEGREDAFFERVPPISVDEAVLERSGRVGTVEADFSWDDVGSWDALGRTRGGDQDGNVLVGEARVIEGRGNVVWTEGGQVVLFGVDDLVVARSGDVTLVTSRNRAAELKDALGRLPERLRDPDAGGET